MAKSIRTLFHGTTEERLRHYSKLDEETGCWVWTAELNKNGYGKVYVPNAGKHSLMAHRVSYETFIGPIPEGMFIDHLCRNRACIFPKHLEVVTHTENCHRGTAGKVLAERTHCKFGHEFSEANTILREGSHGRRCRQCHRDNINRRRQKERTVTARASQGAPPLPSRP